MSTRYTRTADKSLNDKHTRILKDLLQKPANKYCADCKRKDPRWASWNLGIFVCIRCSGVHRSMGTHISKVKSVDLDTWIPDQIESMIKWGNERANIYWEANLKEKTPSESNIDQWIRTKYEQKRWAMRGPIPDPSTLGGEREPEVTIIKGEAKKNGQ
ncbi:putative GTPase activating protein for Arf-domain-containing protein [Phycomyces nitens]|nr:putative GTPase activating protein for Arf-domain-containing protein [Phycomyces nitens]